MKSTTLFYSSRFLSALGLVSILSFPAHALVHLEPECNVNIHGNLRIAENDIEIVTEDGDTLLINKKEQFFRNGKLVALNKQQKNNLSIYVDSIHTAVPMAVDIASDGLEIAGATITEVFGAFLDQDDQLIKDSRDLVTEFSDKLNQQFYDDNGAFTVNGTQFKHNGWFTNQWEDNFEQRGSDIVTKATGKMAIKLAALMISGDEKAKDTLANLEGLETSIDELVEQKANLLEDKANELCKVLEKAEKAETALQTSSDDFAQLNILTVR
jgi:hypothetical protein